MGSQTPSSSDRSRTYWTPTMERFFIDLLLDHMHRGNRSGHTFNKQAWADMLTVFNAQFRSQYDKDALKSRFTTLWKQFNDIKNILDQSGFSWDDTQQMVVADDNAWDAYVKAHPDARSYRNKVLMNFNDLYLIYAYTTADGRYSRSSHDIDFDDDFQGMNFGDGMVIVAIASNGHSKTDWTPSMDQYFVDLMLGQLEKGNMSNNTFKKQAWTDMVALFNARFCSQYSKRDLRHQHKKLLKYYNDVRSLLKEDGFSWDMKQQMIAAKDDTWDSYTKAHPHARAYRKKTLLNFQNLDFIYGSAVSKGIHGFSHQDKDLEEDISQINGEGMEVQVPSCSEHAVAYWTPSMDHYFIDLLLDQVLRGNRIGHAFITQAWIEMVASFNAKFGSHHGKDVLKNRYKQLKRQYNDVKVLVEQRGISWDETQEMEDHVWNYSTKVYSDAETYQNEILPSYDKLCVIYGPESSGKRYSQLVRNNCSGENTQCHAKNNCSKTNWTPSMDRYLIDLMLVQVQLGNKIDHNLNNQAWLHMITSFNERFGSQHDKYILRSRFESFRRLYHAMKNLLDHSGFSWDEMQQMITANDNLWDSYIMENPDAKSFRTEKMPNYNDLCLIYGNFSSNGRCRQSYQDMAFNSSGRDIKAPNSNGGLMTDWTPPMDRYFIDIMLEEVRRGAIVNGKVNKQAWGNMVAKFNKQFGPQHDSGVLKIRFNNLRNCFNDMKILLDKSGFVWDEMLQMVTANDDVWDAYIKENHDAQAYRNVTLPSYNDLFLIYGNVIMSGSVDHSIHCRDAVNYDMGANIGFEMDGILRDVQSQAGDSETSRKRQQSANPPILTYSRKARKISKEGTHHVLGEMANAISTFFCGEEDKNGSSIESIVDALQAIPDMDDELFLDACKLLEDENKAKTFVSLDVAPRKRWLLQNLLAKHP
ncbi:uncharacterized protein LOC131154346 isoform X2 [Malania oleifera]|uniref:uncharacterized protein LOC131154346 isoform X2 n=1 Tax=Malania oleifera TaxID=397392 RepID=UPI0025AEBFC0|nr:uncharacterized protein LOC131154346 isoform X2 [Malania oleifera]